MTTIAARAEVGDDRTLRVAVPCDLPPGPVDVVVNVPADDDIPPELVRELDGMKLYTDEELWRAGKYRCPDGLSLRSEELNFKRANGGLTPAEEEESSTLIRHFNRVMLTRAEAAVLLKGRGHNIDVLLQE